MSDLGKRLAALEQRENPDDATPTIGFCRGGDPCSCPEASQHFTIQLDRADDAGPILEDLE